MQKKTTDIEVRDNRKESSNGSFTVTVPANIGPYTNVELVDIPQWTGTQLKDSKGDYTIVAIKCYITNTVPTELPGKESKPRDYQTKFRIQDNKWLTCLTIKDLALFEIGRSDDLMNLMRNTFPGIELVKELEECPAGTFILVPCFAGSTRIEKEAETALEDIPGDMLGRVILAMCHKVAGSKTAEDVNDIKYHFDRVKKTLHIPIKENKSFR